MSEFLESVKTRLGEFLGQDLLGSRLDRGEYTFWVQLPRWLDTARFLREELGFRVLNDLTAVDYLEREPRFDVSAILTHPEQKQLLRLKIMIDEESCEAPSLVPLWPGANWFEREIFDLFGIRFEGHPDLRRILLPPDYQGHPLRKDYPVTGPADSVYR